MCFYRTQEFKTQRGNKFKEESKNTSHSCYATKNSSRSHHRVQPGSYTIISSRTFTPEGPKLWIMAAIMWAQVK